MYVEYYNLKAMPFQLTPDHHFFFESREHSRAISHLVYGLAQEEGFVVITGDIGAGKTMLVERLWSQLDEGRYLAARILTTQISGDDLLKMVACGFAAALMPTARQGDDPLKMVARGFGMRIDAMDKPALLRLLEQLFAEKHGLGQRCLLVIDEAQNLPFSALEELRMLSNITVAGRAPFQGVLLGQPQFRQMLAEAGLEQLRQRVIASYHLGPLSQEDTRNYVRHRLTTAGWTGDPSFDEAAFTAIHHHSEGIPRKVNTLCSRVLLFGYLEERHDISGAVVEEVAEELRRDLAAGLVEGGPGAAPNGVHRHSLDQRLLSLETAVGRHDKVIRRALEIAAQLLEGRG
ncbi:MAG TPA: AAA family ATPase [Stellaceae bacterium]|nr:AAA family ATPase [Stellaceae bacterium]